MKWLVTGGCGFIGARLVGALRAAGEDVRVLDSLAVGEAEALGSGARRLGDASAVAAPEGLELLVGDIRDPDAVARACAGVEVVVHLAAQTGVQPSISDPLGDCDVNVRGTLTLLCAAREAGVGRFVFASSGAPAGRVVPPIHEDMVPHPASPYGAAKLAGEGYCSAFWESFGLATVVLRFGNVYGPGSGHKQSVVARFLRAGLAGAPIEVWGDGSQTRDFIFVDDLIDAIGSAARTDGIGGEVFQIATSRETSVQELAEAVADVVASLTGSRPEITAAPLPPGDMPRNYSDTTKARERLGWQATTALETGLAATARWFLEAR